MAVLAYQDIRRRCELHGLIDPWSERTKSNGLTYGLGPAGYDICIASNRHLVQGDFKLASSVERFKMPLDLIARVCDKSTWARKGLLVQNTVIEPGWCGFLTLELTYHGTEALLLKAGTPIAQILFETLTSTTWQPYNGKYQDQPRGTGAIFE